MRPHIHIDWRPLNREAVSRRCRLALLWVAAAGAPLLVIIAHGVLEHGR